MKKNISKSVLIKVGFFIIWPFGAFLQSFFTPKKKGSLLIIFLFGVLFAWSMKYENAEFIDLSAIVERFYNQPKWTFGELISYITEVLSFSGRAPERDIYNLIINWLTQRISDNYHLMYLIASIPFMYFMVKSIKLLVGSNNFDNSKITIILLFLFILPKEFFSVQNFRFATASWIFIYEIIRFTKFGNKYSLLLLLITPLIHSSFLYIVPIMIVFLFFKNKLTIIKAVFFVSLPFAFFSSDIFQGVFQSFIPHHMDNWVQGYFSDEIQNVYGLNRTGTGYFWVSLFFDYFKLICYLIGSIILMRGEKNNLANNKLLAFYLLFLSITNFIQFVPVLGSRFWGLSRILFIYLWVNNIYPRANKFVYLLLASCTFEIFYQVFRYYTFIVDSDFYYTPLPFLMGKFIGINSI
jgi:hypothetical protein